MFLGINNYQKIAPSFKGALLNINAISDAHGNIQDVDNAYETIKENKKCMLTKDKQGRKNVLVVSGDWFMAGKETGYYSNPSYNSQKYQTMFFNKFVEKLNNLCGNLTAIFGVGNHDCDAGAVELNKSVNEMNAKVISTNMDLKNSPAVKDAVSAKKLVNSHIEEIVDDKNPKLKHKVLFVAVSPINMPYYCPELRGVKFIDSYKKSQHDIKHEDLEPTMNLMDMEINKFKKNNPKGAVVLIGHTGAGFCEELAQKNGNIDLVLDGHEHLDMEYDINNARVIKLSKDFKKIQNVKMRFDDNGNLIKDGVKYKAYYPKRKEPRGEMHTYFKEVFEKDLEKTSLIEAQQGFGIEELTIDGVRVGNNHLANFVCDAILNQIQKTLPNVEIFALNSSSIRTSIPTQNLRAANNLDFMSTLNGIKSSDAGICTLNASGGDILDIILDNYLLNDEAPQINTILDFSGLKINKTNLLKECRQGKPRAELIKNVIFEKDNKPLQLDAKYGFATVEKLFRKTKDKTVKEMQKRTEPTNLNAKKLYLNNFENAKSEVVAKNMVRIY